MTVTGSGLDAENRVTTTPARNWVGSDPKHGSYMQRISVQFTAPEDGTVTIGAETVAGEGAVSIDDARVMAVEPLTTGFADDVEGVGSPVDVPDGALFWDFEDNQPGYGPFVRGDAGGLGDGRTSISRLNAPYSQKDWKNEHQPFDAGNLDGQAVDDVINGRLSLKAHSENDGLILRTIPGKVSFEPGHAYRVSYNYQASLPGAYQFVHGVDDLAAGESEILKSTPIAAAHDTTKASFEIQAGCGIDFVGIQKSGGANGTDFVIDDVMVEDLGPLDGGAACAQVSGQVTDGDLVAGQPNRVVTTFNNREDAVAEKVWTGLEAPEGWEVKVAEAEGNLGGQVEPGESVTTEWIVTPPSDADTSAELSLTSAYEVNQERCLPREVTGSLIATVTDRGAVPLGQIKATASSEQGGGGSEGPVGNAFDNNPSTLWHTAWNPQPYPHWVEMDLQGEFAVDGFGYLPRQTGGPNGRISEYTIEVSEDGEQWQEVASGTYPESSGSMVVDDFDPVTARYVRLNALAAHNGLDFAAVAELRVYGTGEGDLPEGVDPAPRPESDCEPESALVVTAEPRCLAGTVYLYVSVRNEGDEARSAEVETAYGSKSFASIAPGKVGAVALKARADEIPAGEVTVTADGTEQKVAYQAFSC